MKLFPRSSSRRKLVLLCALVFLLAFTVRLLAWHDTRFEVGKVQTSVAAGYQHFAELLRHEGVAGFFSSTSPLANLNHLGHPPGYSILIALVRSVFGNSDNAIQFTQIVFDGLAAVLILLIVAELFSLTPAVFAGVFAALSPQFAWNSVLLLPDSLAVFPILLAVYLLARWREKPKLVAFLIIGALVGVSVWVRANAMLLTVFFAFAVLLLHGRRQWRYSLAVVAGTLLIVLPLTIRNAITTRHFIPVSLGAGQTLLEGIADYDESNRFGIPSTDMEIMRQEAEIYQRPEYFGTLFQPDGIQRERTRLKRGARVIGSNPFWFAGVMARRATMMMRLERVPIVHLGQFKILRAIHRLFVTAVFLPLALIGLGLTIYRRHTAALLILSVVPLYYFTVQSAFHTEYRYVLAVNYFLFAFAAVAIGWILQLRRKSVPPADRGPQAGSPLGVVDAGG